MHFFKQTEFKITIVFLLCGVEIIIVICLGFKKIVLKAKLLVSCCQHQYDVSVTKGYVFAVLYKYIVEYTRFFKEPNSK